MSINIKLTKYLRYYLFLSLIPFLSVESSYVIDAMYFSWFIILGGILSSLWVGKAGQIIFNKREVIVAFILAIILVLMLSLSDILHSSLLDMELLAQKYSSIMKYGIWLWGHIIYIPSIFISSFLVIYFGIHYFVAVPDQKKEDKKPYGIMEKWNKNYCILLITVVAILYLFSTYPGVWLRDDVVGVWGHVISGEYSHWHTFGYELFVKICTLFLKSPFAVNICQTIIWIFINYYIVSILEDYNLHSMRCYTFIIVLTNTPFFYLQTMFKDVVFSMGMLALVAGIWNVIRTKRVALKDFCFFGVISLFVSICRHSAIVAVLCSFLIVALYFGINKNHIEMIKVLSAFFLHVVVFLLINSVLFQYFEVIPVPGYVKYGTPMAMIGAVAAENVPFDEEDVRILEKVMPVEEWAEYYNPYWADDISRTWGKIGAEKVYKLENLIVNEDFGKDIIKMNAKLLFSHPIIYFRALFDMNSIMWEIGQTPDYSDNVWMVGSGEWEDITRMPMWKITGELSIFTAKVPVLKSLFWRSGCSLFMLLFSIIIFEKNKKREYILAWLPVIIYTCLLAITIPAQDPRYILPIMECAVFAMAVLVGCRFSAEVD